MARIMTVDDSRLVRSIITASLGEAGYETVEAENGKQAMELLAEAPVDLILLDVMMPVMDGPTMLASLRAADNEVPVILLTSKTETSVIARCMQHNLTDYIVKPVKTDELTMKVGKVLGDNFSPGEKGEEEEAKVIDVVAEQLGVDKDKITRDTSFVNDLGADSLDTVELIMELEEEFDTTIPESTAEQIQTVGQAIDFLEQNG